MRECAKEYNKWVSRCTPAEEWTTAVSNHLLYRPCVLLCICPPILLQYVWKWLLFISEKDGAHSIRASQIYCDQVWLTENIDSKNRPARGCFRGAVRKIINKWGEHATLSKLWWKMTGRGATDPRKERKVVDKILEEPSISVRSAGVSVGTVQNIKKRNNLYEEACHRRPRRIQGYMEKSQHEERKIHDQDVNAQGSVQDLKILLWWTSWLIFLLYSILQYFIHNLYY